MVKDDHQGEGQSINNLHLFQADQKLIKALIKSSVDNVSNEYSGDSFEYMCTVVVISYIIYHHGRQASPSEIFGFHTSVPR